MTALVNSSPLKREKRLIVTEGVAEVMNVH